jgi:peptidoglycan/LPS O-acetylase OafA/YrhL
MSQQQKFHIEHLDGLRGPLCICVIAINMGLYNAGANTPVGWFLVLSGITSFLAYGAKRWNDDSSRAQFFLRRLVRLLPMILVSTSFQLCASFPWLVKRGVVIPGATSGGTFNFAVTLLSLVLILAGSGAICRGTACGCCQIDRWPRPPCSLFPLILGTYLTGPGWYVGLLLFLNVYFLPKLLDRYGELWRAAPPTWMVLVGWASMEGLQFGLPLAVFASTQSADAWYYATLYIYLGIPPLFRLVTLIFGLQLGRWTFFEASKQPPTREIRAVTEAKTLIPALATTLTVAVLHGFLEPESELHRPDTGSTPLQWIVIHLIHPFNVLALVCGLVRAPQSLVARFLTSPPLAKLADLSYAMYLLHYGVVTLYVFAFNKKWSTEWELLQSSEDASALNPLDYGAVVLLVTALAYPVTHWIEPRVATWLKARVETPMPPYHALP